MVFSVTSMMEDLSVAIMLVTVFVAIMQLEVSAAHMQVTVSAANTWTTVFIVIMQIGVSVAIMQLVFFVAHYAHYCFYCVTIPRCYKNVFVNNFFPRTARLWNSLPIECFSLTYDRSGFKSRINRHILTVDSF